MHRGLLVAIIAVPLILLLAGVGAYLLWPTSVTITGEVTLVSRTGIDGTVVDCSGRGGYADLREGAQVVVTGPSGEVVGVTQLGTGHVPQNATCTWAFSVDVPERDIYGVKVATRNVLQFTRAEVDHPLQIQIGS